MKMKIREEVRKMMPQFFDKIEKGEIHVYDAGGFTRELTDEMKDKIKEMKEQYKMNVVAVVDSVVVFLPEDERAHMTCYIYDEPGDEPWIIDNESVGFIANVVNHSWDIEESGSIGLTERVGCVFRTY